MSEWRVPLSDLDYGAPEEAAVLRVLRSKWLSMGPEVLAFEQEIARFTGARHGIAVSNGTAALHLSYLALGLESGDAVIQPAINFVAAANMTVTAGAVPVFADIEGLHRPTIDPADIERKITPRTKAVVVMHYGGHLCRMDEIRALCGRHGLAVIEDACHAIGARYLDPRREPPYGRMAGTLGDIACFSFFSNKNLAVGEGGMLVTDRDDLAERVRMLRTHGMTTLTWDRHRGHASSYEVTSHGYNYRLDELRAALGRVQLEKLEHNNHLRKLLTEAYRRHLSVLPDWTLPFLDDRGESAYHLMVAVAPNERLRDRVRHTLKEAGIQTSLHYPCLADFEAFERFRTSSIERSRSFARRALTLPLFPGMTVAQVEEICSIIHDAVVESQAHKR